MLVRNQEFRNCLANSGVSSTPSKHMPGYYLGATLFLKFFPTQVIKLRGLLNFNSHNTELRRLQFIYHFDMLCES